MFWHALTSYGSWPVVTTLAANVLKISLTHTAVFVAFLVSCQLAVLAAMLLVALTTESLHPHQDLFSIHISMYV